MVPAGARLFCLGMLALILTLPCKLHVGVGAITFSFNGFKQSDVYIVSGSRWTFSPTDDYNYFYLKPTSDSRCTSVAGRFLYPGLVQMTDPGSTTVKSFSTTFIYQIQIKPGNSATGPGMAFIIVPDNFTVGANRDYMGIVTSNTSTTGQNFDSDKHTFALELDTYLNPEFDDPNENHIGMNLASMTSTHTYKPSFNLASDCRDILQQIWIEYFQTDSHMNIYLSLYGQGKPATPQVSWTGLDLSILKENMYVGFSGAVGIESNNWNVIYAWSFSNDGGTAPPIFIGPDAPPASTAPPPPPPSTPPPSTSPPASKPFSLLKIFNISRALL